jgi:sarcosine oxidase subunit beta
MKNYDTLIIGGGGMGLSIAYNLKKMGKPFHVLEGSYYNAGSTGRNTGLVRARSTHSSGTGHADIVKLALEGMRLYSTLSSETGINLFYRKGGGLIVSRDVEELEEQRRLHETYRKQGIRFEEMTAGEIESRWPYINADCFEGGFYAPDEASIHPFSLTWAYLENVKENVEKENRAKSISRGSQGFQVETENGEISARNVVISCGRESSRLAGMLGYKIPFEYSRKEMFISEAIRPLFGPSIENPSEMYRITQTMRGEILGTIGHDAGSEMSVLSSRFLEEYAKMTVRLIPVFRNLNLIRQWVGTYQNTPDEKPVAGKLDEGLYMVGGFMDYGLTLIPVIGRLMAEIVSSGHIDPLIEPFSPLRF